MATLTCKNIKKSYKNVTVLEDVNLTIEQGKIYGLIGRNGVGKTTLLSIMTAQSAADQGSVSLDDMPVWENQKALDHLCFSRELNALTIMGPNNQKVKEYLKLASIYYPNWDQEMANELIQLFQIDPKKPICKMSKGMMSMVTIIIGLASKADITILDEPVAGLDVVAREQFYRLLIEEQTQTGRSFIISTHIIEEAADLFEEVIILKNRNVLLKENTLELLERSFRVTGLGEDVDEAVKGLNVAATEKIGRSKAVTVMLEAGQSIANSDKITVQPLSLQNLFIALCGQEA